MPNLMIERAKPDSENVWARAPPPVDPRAARKSREIDVTLRKSRAAALSAGESVVLIVAGGTAAREATFQALCAADGGGNTTTTAKAEKLLDGGSPAFTLRAKTNKAAKEASKVQRLTGEVAEDALLVVYALPVGALLGAAAADVQAAWGSVARTFCRVCRAFALQGRCVRVLLHGRDAFEAAAGGGGGGGGGGVGGGAGGAGGGGKAAAFRAAFPEFDGGGPEDEGGAAATRFLEAQLRLLAEACELSDFGVLKASLEPGGAGGGGVAILAEVRELVAGQASHIVQHWDMESSFDNMATTTAAAGPHPSVSQFLSILVAVLAIGIAVWVVGGSN